MPGIGDLLTMVGQFKGVMDERKARELEEFLKKQQAEQERLDSEARRKLAEIQGKAAMEDIETSRSKRAQDSADALMKRLREAAGIVPPGEVIEQTRATGQPMRFGLPGATPSRSAEVNLGSRMGAMRQGISGAMTPQQRQVQGEAERSTALSMGVASQEREKTSYNRRIQEEELALRREGVGISRGQLAVAERGEARLGVRQGVELDEITRQKVARTRIAEIVRSQVMGEGGSQADADTLAERVMVGDFPTRDEKVWATVDTATHRAAMYLRAGLTSADSVVFDERLLALSKIKDTISAAAYDMLEDQIYQKYLGAEFPIDPKAREVGIREWASVAAQGRPSDIDQLVRLAMQSSLVGSTGMAILNQKQEGQAPTAGRRDAEFVSVLVAQKQALQRAVGRETATPEQIEALEATNVMIATLSPEGYKVLMGSTGQEPGITPGQARQQTSNLGALERVLSQSPNGSKYFNIISGTATIPPGRPDEHQPTYDFIVDTLRREKSLWTAGNYNASEAILFLGRLSEAMGKPKTLPEIRGEIGYDEEDAYGQRLESGVRGASPSISGDLSRLERAAMAEAPAVRQQISAATDVMSLDAVMESFRTRIGTSTATRGELEILRANETSRELRTLYEQRRTELSQQVPTQGQPRQRAPQAAPSAPPGSAPPVIPSQRMPSRPPTSSLPQDTGNQDIVGRILRSNHPGHLKKKLLRTVFPDMDDSSLERMTMNYGSSLVGRRTLPRDWTT